MQKLITVITATYNAGKTLERCILSVIEQKGNDIEYIIADGASTDNTMDVVRKYQSSIDCVISEPDRGVYDAWNKALRHAHGKWILFLGADDFYEPDAFDLYRGILDANECSDIDIVSAKCRLINSQGKELRIFGNAYDWDQFRHGTNCLSHGTTLHNRKLFSELGDYDLRFDVNADFEFLLRKRMKALFLDHIILNMQDGGISYSSKGIYQSFLVKRFHHSADVLHDVYYLVKGLSGFYVRRFLWRLTK